MEHPVDGILLVDKAKGETSFDVVRRIRRVFQTRKVGHAGTLDPLATGVLVILLGQGTKLSRFIMSQRKIYQGTLMLGVATDTLDCMGKITRTMAVPNLTRNKIDEKCRMLTGEIDQTPPRYSAVRWKGRRAYELARQGLEFNPPERKVNVESLEVVSENLPYITIKVQCSAGTYVRSLAVELGRSLGTLAHLTSLRRLASGQFVTNDAFPSDLLSKNLDRNELEKEVIPLNKALSGMYELEVGDLLAERIRQGYQPKWEELSGGRGVVSGRTRYVKIVKNEELVAVVNVQQKGSLGVTTELMRVFH